MVVVVAAAAAGTKGVHQVLPTSWKRVGSSGGSETAFTRPISVVLPSAGPPVRKRQRLTHLTPEEKALRRKSKNKIAAQKSRERRKAKMRKLQLENERLHIENRLLREQTKNGSGPAVPKSEDFSMDKDSKVMVKDEPQGVVKDEPQGVVKDEPQGVVKDEPPSLCGLLHCPQ